jgi:long-subunit fatty acid transport protein
MILFQFCQSNRKIRFLLFNCCRTRCWKLAAGLFLPAVCLVFSNPSLAGPVESFGMGSMSNALAQSGNASMHGWRAAHYNPAGLAGLWKPDRESFHGLAISYSLEATSAEITQKFPKAADDQARADHQTSRNNATQAVDGLVTGRLQFGFTTDMRSIFHIPGDLPLVLGGAISSPQKGTIAQVDDTSGRTYQFVQAGPAVQRLVLDLAMGMQVWKDHLSIGAGVGILAGGEGAMRMKNIDLDPSARVQTPEQNIKMDLKPQVIPIVGAQFSWDLPLRQKIATGLSWQGESWMEINPLDAVGTTTLLNVDLNLRLAVTDHYTPHIFRYGVSWQMRPFTVHADLEWHLWSGYFHGETRRIHDPAPPNFNDIWIPRLGFETEAGKWVRPMRKLDWRVQAGYAWIPSVTPVQDQDYNYLDSSRHHFGLGSSIKLPSNKVVKSSTTIHLGLGLQLWNERNNTKKEKNLNDLNPDFRFDGNSFIASLSISLAI